MNAKKIGEQAALFSVRALRAMDGQAIAISQEVYTWVNKKGQVCEMRLCANNKTRGAQCRNEPK
jgi:hypothetical protein